MTGAFKNIWGTDLVFLTSILNFCNEPNLLFRLKCYFLMRHKCSMYAIEPK